MSLPKFFTLNTGAKIPTVAFGTYGAGDKEIYDAVSTALKVGYRHIDAAYYYQNEKPVGKAIRDSKIPREDIFVTTKCWPTQMQDPAKALNVSLENLGLEYVDLYLMHWPVATIPDPEKEFSWGLGLDKSIDYIDIWEKFQQLPKEKVRAIGVSNFTVNKLEKLLASERTSTVPATNQCEFHPNLPQTKLVNFCLDHKIVPEAFCPLARGQVDDPVVKKIADEHGVTPGQVVLSWNVERGVVVLPKSVTPSRIESNLKTVKLSDKNMEDLAELGKNPHRLIKQSVDGIDIFEGDVDSH